MIYNGEECYGVIYTVTHIASGKKYVGQTTNLKSRWAGYRRLECKQQPRLIHALRKHGVDAFAFDVIFVAYDKTQLDWLECWFIEELGSMKFGYNCTSGGSNGKPGAETRAKLSAARTGRKLTPEAIEKMRIANIGRVHTPETKAKLSALRKGKPQSPETCEKKRIAHLGKTMPPETRAKIRAAHVGKILSPEHCEKMRAANLGKTLSPETKKKIGLGGRRRFEKPGARERATTALHKRYEDPKEREKTGAIMRKRYADPAERRKQSERLKEYWRKRKLAKQQTILQGDQT